MATFSAIDTPNNTLVHKSLGGGMFVAAMTAAAVTRSNLFETGGGIAAAGVPTGYKDVGLLTEDGIRFGRSQETDQIMAWQTRTPVREETTSDVETVQIDMLEMNRQSLELYNGVDLSAAPYTNGAISIQKPEIPTDRYYRVLTISVDNVDGKERYVVYFFPRCKVTTWGEQRFSRTGALTWGVTLTAFKDDTLGYTKDTMIGGPALADVEVAMGLPAIS